MSSRLDMYRGDTALIIVVVAGAVLAGADLRFTAKRSSNDEDADALITKTTADGIDVDDNVATITIEPEDTDALNRRTLVWDLQVTDGSGQVATVAVGSLRIHADISRTTP